MNQRLLAMALLSSGLLAQACGKSSSKDEAAAVSTTWTDTAMQQLVMAKCATSGCHDGSNGQTNYATISEAGMKAHRAALTEVEAYRMPQTGRLSETQIATFRNFYNN